MLDPSVAVDDPRESCKVKHHLPEGLFLVTFALIAGCDDDRIASWGASHDAFAKGDAAFFFGTPEEDWLRVVLNRISAFVLA